MIHNIGPLKPHGRTLGIKLYAAHTPVPRMICCLPTWQVIKNVAAFCACAGLGQTFVFYIIKEFGSLVNVTVTISRKFFRYGSFYTY